jgi:hypothetical protein
MTPSGSLRQVPSVSDDLADPQRAMPRASAILGPGDLHLHRIRSAIELFAANPQRVRDAVDAIERPRGDSRLPPRGAER